MSYRAVVVDAPDVYSKLRTHLLYEPDTHQAGGGRHVMSLPAYGCWSYLRGPLQRMLPERWAGLGLGSNYGLRCPLARAGDP